MEMTSKIFSSILLLVLASNVFADEIELEATSGRVLKMLREMVNQTNADSLNLPANASSIRENITDTFSCDNLTYGYYADMDNDCQLFHVCLPSQTPSGRNVTYRYSFICPAETVFNQEVLTCTRPRDSIPCEDSASYYDLNMEIGKVPEEKNETAQNKEPEKSPETNKDNEPNKETETIPVNNQKRFPSRKKQSIIVERLMKEAIEEINKMENVEEVVAPEVIETEMKPEVVDKMEGEDENSRLGSERKLKRTGRLGWRGSYKYGDTQ
ncbi:uncharacterized protein LOC126968348 [Leptidea sinapis]|uniref:Chitin-binding type-2 domain-containing protein n=1 Tax=Leptidea sinapis TaxID=189913 RepID=A0A5E4PVX8_9NEOP|nr:uncharacterized protein LOC126968348 [Leptidea sinapis]VVC89425.1 unnamed protein product [Leptidea sinapis]